MDFNFDERESDSPYVAMVWRTQNEHARSFTSIASTQLEMVITRQQGKRMVTFHGPETKATVASVPASAEFMGITFKLGTFMPHLPLPELIDNPINLPDAASDRSFWLQGTAWEVPDYENADTFVQRLVSRGMLEFNPVVASAITIEEQPPELSERTVQRHFLRTIGLTQKSIQQIDRARYALDLLERGTSVLDTVYMAGYSDQSHLTRSLKRLIGKTPAQILLENTGG